MRRAVTTTRPFRSDAAKYVYGYSGPALVVTLALVVLPLLYAVWASFHGFSFSSDVPQWVGYRNYLRLLTDPNLHNSLWATAAIVLPALTIEMILGLAYAVALNALSRGRGLLTTIMALPVLVSGASAGMSFRMLFTPKWGPLDNLLTSLTGLPSIDWLGNPTLARTAIVIADVWQNTPFVMLIALAALAAIPRELNEAASVDGAGAVRRFISIEFPLIRKFLLVALLFRLIDLSRIFDVIFVMTGGGPASSTESISSYIYRQGIQSFDIGYAAVIGLALAILSLIVSYYAIRLMRREAA